MLIVFRMNWGYDFILGFVIFVSEIGLFFSIDVWIVILIFVGFVFMNINFLNMELEGKL